MKLSRNKIAYNLFDSPYHVTAGAYTFVFSSVLHMEKFKTVHTENRDNFKMRFHKLVKISLESDTLNFLADLALYQEIENRGNLIITEKGEFLRLKDLKIYGTIIKNGESTK